MKHRILIVDDEAAIRSSLLESLSSEGYDAEIAESGEEALAKCHGAVYDLVVTDLRLPGVDGLEILKALRNQGNATPVIMMTAYGDMDTALEAMNSGAYRFIPKPFKLGEMKKQVRAALRATAEPRETKQEIPPSETNGAKVAAAAPRDFDGLYMGMINACPDSKRSPRSWKR